MPGAKRGRPKKPTAVDLFCGCGGLTLGLKRAGFRVRAGIDSDSLAVITYRANHPDVKCIHSDIAEVSARKLRSQLDLKSGELTLLAGCPPCQGFSRLRTKNGARRVRNTTNDLIFEILRFVRVFRPQAIMVENVPRLASNWRIHEFRQELRKLGYASQRKILNASDFGVPQRRRRMILIAQVKGEIRFAEPFRRIRSVRSAIGNLPRPEDSRDSVHNYRVRRATKVREIIRNIPKDGGSRTNLPRKQILRCHKSFNGFSDIYGRMKWSAPAPTITGGCINPSKGRFLHPKQNRAITLREAALLQGFPKEYSFETSRGRYPVAQMIGNAFPPGFAEPHAREILMSIGATLDEPS